MRRDKAWWAGLDKGERIRLIWLERGASELGGGSAYLPEGYSDCGFCSTPTSGGGLCKDCRNDLMVLIAKADKKCKGGVD